MGVQPIPDGYHTVTPYLVVNGVDKVLEFIRRAFGGEETVRMNGNDGAVAHAEIKVGDSLVMLGEAGGPWEPMPGVLHLYVEDCDATYRRAIEAGGESLREPENQFYGDRSGGVRDPAGNLWWITTHVEDVPEEEMARRAQEWAAQQSS